MKSHTHREYLTWIEYLDQQWNIQTPDQHYLAQVALEVKRSVSKKPWSLKNFFIRFVKKGETPPSSQPTMTADEATRLAKARWGARIGRR